MGTEIYVFITTGINNTFPLKSTFVVVRDVPVNPRRFWKRLALSNVTLAGIPILITSMCQSFRHQDEQNAVQGRFLAKTNINPPAR